MNTLFQRVPANGFQQVQSPAGVHVEIIERPRGGQVMAGLGRGMDDRDRSKSFKQSIHATTVSDIALVVREVLVCSFKAVLIPACVALWPEKVGPHIIVNTMNLPARVTEIINNLRANQSG